MIQPVYCPVCEGKCSPRTSNCVTCGHPLGLASFHNDGAFKSIIRVFAGIFGFIIAVAACTPEAGPGAAIIAWLFIVYSARGKV